MAKSLARERIKRRLRGETAPGEQMDEELVEEVTEAAEEIEDAQSRARERRLRQRHRKMRPKPSVREAKVHLRRSVSQLRPANLGAEAIERARTYLPLDVISRRPIESAAVALAAGMVVGSIPAIRKGLGKLLGWGLDMIKG